MGQIRKTVNFNVFTADQSWVGVTSGFKKPDLERLMEAVKVGGVDGEIEIDMGSGGALVVGHKYVGEVPEIAREFGNPKIDGVMVRFVAVVQDDLGRAIEHEIVIRGQHKKLARPETKVGEPGETEFETSCVYYRETFDGRRVFEIDKLNHVHFVGDTDILADQRRILQI